MSQIAYRTGYKYQLAEPYQVQTDIRPPAAILTDYVILLTDGRLLLAAGYAWDGATGAIDTLDSMRGSLVHDAFYQLMREGLLGQAYREAADKELRKIVLEDGMVHFRAQAWYEAVRAFAESAADPANNRPVIRAP